MAYSTRYYNFYLFFIMEILKVKKSLNERSSNKACSIYASYLAPKSTLQMMEREFIRLNTIMKFQICEGEQDYY